MATIAAEPDAYASLAILNRPLAEDLARRVRRGAILLDAALPGWAGRLDLDRLDIESYTDDVLGQLYGEFHRGCSVLGCCRWSRGDWQASDYGFGFPNGSPLWSTADDVIWGEATLEEVWGREVRVRLEGEGVELG